jgi:hypothetical protein
VEQKKRGRGSKRRNSGSVEPIPEVPTSSEIGVRTEEMGGDEHDKADGVDGHPTPPGAGGHTPPLTSTSLVVAPATSSSSSSSLVAGAPSAGPSAKLKLFVEMFKTIFGDETYATELEEVLMKKKLLSQHMLVQERTILKVQASCKVIWEAKFDADSAETATDAIEATREVFKKAHDHGGLYYTAIPSLGVTPVRIGAVASSTSSGTSMVIGGASGAAIPIPTSGNIGKTASSQTRDRDNEIFGQRSLQKQARSSSNTSIC